MIGAGFAMLTSLSWATSSIILKFLSSKIDSLSINTLRLWVGSLVLLTFIALSGRVDELIHTPLLPTLYIVISGIVAVAIGDTVYIWSLSYLDVSRAYPIAQSTFPILTMFVAISVLNESFTWINGAGAALVVLGVYLIATAGRESGTYSASRKASWKGVMLALTAAVAWTIGAATLKMGATSMDPFVAAAIRIPASAIPLSLFTLSRRRRGTLQLKSYGRRNLGLAGVAGVLAYVVAGVSYVVAVQLIGAGRAVLLTATAPLFVLPMSILILKERPTRIAIVGVFICFAGVYMVTL